MVEGVGEHAQWARDHKKEVVAQLLCDYRATSGASPSAFFMAGLPGAGKTEFAESLLDTLAQGSVIRLDMDKIATMMDGYDPKNADQFRAGASILLDRALDVVIDKRMNFLLDGTFSKREVVERNINRVLRAGYHIKIFYIVQEPKVAWHFTKEREKVEHRAIDENGFVEAFFQIPNNIFGVLEHKHDKISIDIIEKDSTNKIKGIKEEVGLQEDLEIVKTKVQCYNEETLKEHLND